MPKEIARSQHTLYLNAGNAAGGMVADFTPAYALLPEARFAEMAALTGKTRFLFLLRDPLDRLWSNLRMTAYRETRGGEAYQARANQLLDQFIDGAHPSAAARSDYAATLRNLGNAVPRDDVFLGFFEDLFTQGTMDRITGFLGLSPISVALREPVHQGRALTLDSRRRSRALDRLHPQYDAVSNAMAGRLPARWQAQLSRG